MSSHSEGTTAKAVAEHDLPTHLGEASANEALHDLAAAHLGETLLAAEVQVRIVAFSSRNTNRPLRRQPTMPFTTSPRTSVRRSLRPRCM